MVDAFWLIPYEMSRICIIYLYECDFGGCCLCTRIGEFARFGLVHSVLLSCRIFFHVVSFFDLKPPFFVLPAHSYTVSANAKLLQKHRTYHQCKAHELFSYFLLRWLDALWNVLSNYTVAYFFRESFFIPARHQLKKI